MLENYLCANRGASDIHLHKFGYCAIHLIDWSCLWFFAEWVPPLFWALLETIWMVDRLVFPNYLQRFLSSTESSFPISKWFGPSALLPATNSNSGVFFCPEVGNSTTTFSDSCSGPNIIPWLLWVDVPLHILSDNVQIDQQFLSHHCLTNGISKQVRGMSGTGLFLSEIVYSWKSTMA